jgi:Leucine-rich repeat (LRR) protein
MRNCFKIKEYSILTLCMMFYSLTTFAQDYDDKTIGFDVDRITTSLREYGVSNQEMAYEIKNVREMYLTSYKTFKIAKDKIQDEIDSQQTIKTIYNKSAKVLTMVQDIPPAEKEALFALYNSTNGDSWINKTGWDFNTPVTAWNGSTGWFGITLTNNHVRFILLSNNNLTGSIPTQIDQLSELTGFNFSNNKLQGNIPKEIGKLTKMQQISLSNNNLQGAIPPEIGLLENLEILYLAFNRLNNVIPFQISNLSKLQHLMLGYNEFSGVLPPEMSRLSKLTAFLILNNKFEGALPDFTNTNLASLNISSNKFRFVDFAAQYSFYKNRPGLSFRYENQGLTDTVGTIMGIIGGTVSLTMYENGRFSPQDSYQWYRNNTLISGATSRTYTISNLETINSGSYNCISTNSLITDLILTREPIILNVTDCIPIIGKLKIGKTPNLSLPTSLFKYEGLWLSNDTGNNPEVNSWVDYLDNSGIQKRTIVGSLENGCKEILASKIVATNGVGDCLECLDFQLSLKNDKCEQVDFVDCMGMLQTVFVGGPITISAKKIVQSRYVECNSTEPVLPPEN